MDGCARIISSKKNKFPKWIILFLVIAVVFIALQMWRAKEKTEQKYMVNSVLFHEIDRVGKGVISILDPTLTIADEMDGMKGTEMNEDEEAGGSVFSLSEIFWNATGKRMANVMDIMVPCLSYTNLYGQNEVALCEQGIPAEYLENGGVDESSGLTVEAMGVTQDGGDDSKADNQVREITSAADHSNQADEDVNEERAVNAKEEPSRENGAEQAATRKKFKPSPNHTYSSVYTDQQLASFSFVKSTLYVPDAITPVSDKDLNVKKLMGINLSLDDLTKKDSKASSKANSNNSNEKQKNTNGESPLVLIYHTHTSEAFADSRNGHVEDTVVGAGDVLTKELVKRGIPTMHDTTVYDVIDGKLDRSAAYNVAGESVQRILAKNPSIQVVIDLHRDGVAEGTRLVTTVDGKKMAQIMLFNGMSRIKDKGEIAYLTNPYRKENLAFSLQVQLKGLDQYDGLMRKIFLRSYRYNLHFRERSLLVEAGAQTNKVQEVKNSMVPLGNLVAQVLLGE